MSCSGTVGHLEPDGRRRTIVVVTATRVRREPPPFREVEVARVEPRSPRMVLITLAGPALEGLDPGLPAASVRLLLLRTSIYLHPSFTAFQRLQ